MDNLRKIVTQYLIHIFCKLCTQFSLTIKNLEDLATAFELDMYKLFPEVEYIKIANKIDTYLLVNDGYFPDDILGIKYIKNEITVHDIFNYVKINNTPRIQIVKLFVTLFYKYNKDKDFILELSKIIEKSCYNAIIKNSKQSEDPPCRHWDSPIFVDIYSNRCGAIYNLLDPESVTNKYYKSGLLQDIFDGKIDPKDIGLKSEKDLCPQATQKERDEIAIRSEQQVKEKKSNLFRCPNCKKREVTYTEVQLRALDEAPDYLCKCLNCNYRFRGR